MNVLSILRSAGAVFFLNISGAVFALLMSMLFARTIGPEGYGKYAYFLSLAMVLAIPVAYGLSDLIARSVALQGKASAEQSAALVSTSMVFVGVYGVLLGLGIALYTSWSTAAGTNSFELERLSRVELYLLAPAVLLAGLTTLLRGLCRGRGYPVISQLSEGLLQPMAMLLLVLGCVGLGRFSTGSDAIVLRVLSVVVALLLMLLLAARKRVFAGLNLSITSVRAGLLKPVFAFSLLGGMDLINKQLDILLLAQFADLSEVGFYKVSVTIANIVAFIILAVKIPLGPELSRLFKVGQLQVVQAKLRALAGASFVLSLFAVAFLALFGELILRVCFGEAYIASYWPLLILALGTLLNALFGFVGLVLNMSGNERSTLLGYGIAVLVNIALNSVLIPIYGGIGAAIGTALSNFCWCLVLYLLVRKKLALNTFSSFRLRALHVK